jgi:formate/nitrite transporter
MDEIPEHQLKALRPDHLSGPETLAKMEAAAVSKARMPLLRQIVLSMMAGFYIGIGAAFFGLVISDASLPFAIQRILGGLVFSLGLFLVVCATAELFTGNILMTSAAVSKKISWLALLKNWAIVWLGNLAGALLCAALVFLSNYGGLASGQAIADALVGLASAKVGIEPAALFFKAVMCNVLVCLAIWLTFAARTIIDKFVAVAFPITAFVAMGFEHSVANMFFLPLGFLMKAGHRFSDNLDSAILDRLDIGAIAYNISVVTLGNIIGGALLVACAYRLAHGPGRKAPSEQ